MGYPRTTPASLGGQLSKAAIAQRLGVSRRVIYHWIATGQLARDLDAPPPRRSARRATKLDSYERIIDERLTTYPALSAVRSRTCSLRQVTFGCTFKAGQSVVNGHPADAFGRFLAGTAILLCLCADRNPQSGIASSVGPIEHCVPNGPRNSSKTE